MPSLNRTDRRITPIHVLSRDEPDLVGVLPIGLIAIHRSVAEAVSPARSDERRPAVTDTPAPRGLIGRKSTGAAGGREKGQ